MNDYKELIEKLEHYLHLGDAPIGRGWGALIDKQTLKDAINAIEQLVKAQKETAYLLKQYIPFTDNPCGFCAHKNAKYDTKEFIENCDVCLEAQHYCCWEYGGLSDAMKASMELNEILKAKLREWRELK